MSVPAPPSKYVERALVAAHLQDIVVRPAPQEIDALAAIERVVADKTGQMIVALVAENGVGAAGRQQLVADRCRCALTISAFFEPMMVAPITSGLSGGAREGRDVIGHAPAGREVQRVIGRRILGHLDAVIDDDAGEGLVPGSVVA